MKIRIIDYVGNNGGGIRFSIELLESIILSRNVSVELISYGDAADRYKQAFLSNSIKVKLTTISPFQLWKNKTKRIFNIPFTGRIMKVFGYGSKWRFDVPNEAFADCDLVWFPWMHQHRIPANVKIPVVASFHDAILFMFDGLISKSNLKEESISVRDWVGSNSRIVVSSHSTINTLVELFSFEPSRFDLVPVSGEHVPYSKSIPKLGKWQSKPYLIYPANIFPHKNHETLLKGYAEWGAKYPIVLTGAGTKLQPLNSKRRWTLYRLMKKLHLSGENVIQLGYVDDSVYFPILSNCYALVMTTKAEGGGSFPVFEAMQLGIPVICSDIPVLREQMQRTGGEVLWFDVDKPNELANVLRDLDNNYNYYKDRSIKQILKMKKRSWSDVSSEYLDIFKSISS
jgi:glycosyltransferase involved in cell wall biosynthesis